MATKINPTETYPLTYRTDAIKTLTCRLSIPPTRISKSFGYTNNKTVERWLNGYDIYLASLLNLCNTYNLDLLSFITYEGNAFMTNIGDIIKMEKAGIDLRKLLSEKGIEPCKYSESRTLSPLSEPDTDTTSSSTRTHTTKTAASSSTMSTDSLPVDIIDKIVAIQCQAHEHERQMLEQQRADMQTIIDDKDKQIAKLEKELKRLRVVERASKPYFGVVADESSATE